MNIIDRFYVLQKYDEAKGKWCEFDDSDDGSTYLHFCKADAIHNCRDWMNDEPDTEFRVRMWDLVNERDAYTMTDKAEEDAMR